MIQLFDYQRQDVEKLAKNYIALNASQMGTGKTVVAIELDKVRRIQSANANVGIPVGKTLVVAPLSVLDVWRQHYNDMLPGLKVSVCNRKKRTQFLDVEADIYVVHYEAVRILEKDQLLSSRRWLHIILDECHRIQNRKAQTTQAIKRIPTVYKTALSGTPVTTHPDKFWSVLNWLDRRNYKSYWRFFNRFIDFDVKMPEGYRIIKGPKNEALLHHEIADFYVRRTKTEVLPDLPPKLYSEITVELEPKQRRAYEDMRKSMLAWVGEHEDQPLPAPIVVAQLTRLQQFADGFAEIDARGSVHLSEPSSKLDALMQLLDDNPDEQFVVFSRFSQMIQLLEARLRRAGISHTILTGDTPQELRPELIRRFQHGTLRVFAGTIAAGGVGITLTAASHVVFLDREWSPALNEQAEDRLHRHGQTEPVHVIDIMARSTVDHGKKQDLILKAENLRKLLTPPSR